MTEDEAKTKWCPFARVVVWHEPKDELTPPFNRFQAGLDKTDLARCVGSDCMAWCYFNRPEDGHGYCGLAGK